MKKKKILFIASLPTKKMNFDGERNKSRDILNSLKKENKYAITIIDLSKNQYFQIGKMILKQMFVKYDYIFVSKCILGGSLAIHILNKIRKKNNIYFYIIGNGYHGFENKKVYFDDIAKCKHIIVESDLVKESMAVKNIPLSNISIFPCLKPTYDINVLEKDYSGNQPLKLLFFSRINPDKGLGDLIDVLIDINENNQNPLFYLDIAGGVSDEPGIKEFEKQVIDLCQKHSYLNYLGMQLRIDGINSYKQIQQYDLHVFPSRFIQECAPGSILDMFVAGVPTLSSTYPSYKTLINQENSVLFEQNNKESLKTQLIYIYQNAHSILNNKRRLSHQEYYKYTDKAFIGFLETIGIN